MELLHDYTRSDLIGPSFWKISELKGAAFLCPAVILHDGGAANTASPGS